MITEQLLRLFNNDMYYCCSLLTIQLFNHSVGLLSTVKSSAIMGLGIAYANRRKEEIKDLLEPFISDSSSCTLVESSLAALSIGKEQ